MKNMTLSILRASVLLMCMLLLAVTVGLGQDAAQYRENIESIRKEMEDLRKEITDLEQREKSESKSLENITKQIYLREQLVKKYASAESRLRRSLQSTETDIANKSKTLTITRVNLSKQLRHLYLHGRTPYMTALLDSDNLTAAAVRMRYLKYFLDYEREQLTESQNLITELRTKRSQVSSGYLENRRLRQAKQKEATDLTNKRSQKDRQIKEISKSIEAIEANLKAKETSLTQIQTLLTRLAREATKTAPDVAEPSGSVTIRNEALKPPVPFAALKGKLPYPVQGSIVEKYGSNYNSQLKIRFDNPGVTLSAKPGANVHAIAYGRVAQVTYMPGYGPMLIVQHDDEYFSVYSPIAGISVDIGQVVRAGQTIGKVGENGLGEGNRFSLMVYRNGAHVNPTAWISSKVVARR
jgi:murein hydrolase activator